ncbi:MULTISPECIES: hypothetical protein [Actinomycetaceae]|uniref:hypothetical protein n=1 Tax=Actinomycetaceae TaxID=2049 RepID=UPI0008A33F33|nr:MULTISPECIES: hypothetical protein [Actinomycetaceae]MBS5825564.1 hypothetical protein [Actinomyces sp.]MDP9835174.1 hypothetical protein [Gleimia europaea]OFJ63226.1 hypothetical protein HMPREF2854_02325 [Actinomyces sp. HMSC075B09]
MNVFSKGAALIGAGKARVWAGLASLDLNPVPKAPPGVDIIVQTMLNWLIWISGVTAIAGVVIVGILLKVSNECGIGNEGMRRVCYITINAIAITFVLALLKLLL